MKIISRVIIVLALAALGFRVWTIFFPSPDKIIRKQLARLAQDVSFTQDENTLVKIADANRVPDFFSSNVQVNITIPGHQQQTMAGRDEIKTAVLAAFQQITELSVKFPDVNVSVAPDKKSATADVTVDATVSGERDAVIQELKITFQKAGSQWLITKMDTVQGVSPP